MSPAAVDAKGRIPLAGFVGSPIHERERASRGGAPSWSPACFPTAESTAPSARTDGSSATSPVPLELNSAQATLDPKARLLVAGIVTRQGHPDGAFAVVRYLLGS
jgi:hypothetical protein